MIVNNRTQIVFGENSLSELRQIEDKKILVITDKYLYENHVIDIVLNKLENNKLIIFFDVKPDPTLSVVSKALSVYMKNNIDCIIAIGGGSVIDTAKGVIYFGRDRFVKMCNFIAIPTTSGTGSEVTSVTVLTDEDTKIKHLLQDEDIVPNIAILDVDLTKNLPQNIIANTGIDVLSHALEAYVGKNANEYSDALAEKSGELIVNNLYKSYLDKKNIEAKSNMHMASMMAGLAFENAGLGLNHSIAHQLGGQFHIPHGLANGILLNSVITINCKNLEAKAKYILFAKKIGVANQNLSEEDSISALVNFIDFLQKKMNMPRDIISAGVEAEVYKNSIEELAINALKDNCMKTTPYYPSKFEIIEILMNLL